MSILKDDVDMQYARETTMMVRSFDPHDQKRPEYEGDGNKT